MLRAFFFDFLRTLELLVLALLLILFTGGGLLQLQGEWRALEPGTLDLLFPSPSEIHEAWLQHRESLLELHIPATLWATLTGLSIAIFIGLFLAALMDFVPALRWILYPVLVFSQTIPTFAIAVMLILVFGFGYGPKIVVVAIFSFFAITLNTLDGLQSVNPVHTALLRSMKASRWQIWWKVRLPTAMPAFFSGLRLSATYSVVGAVIGEYVGGGDGLGKFLQRSYRTFATEQVFLAVIIIALLSAMLLLLVYLIEAVVLRWRYAEREQSTFFDSIQMTLRERFTPHVQ